MQKIQGRSHFADAPVVASHVVERHGLTELVVFAKDLRLLQEVESTIDILLFEVVDCEDIADFAQLLT